MTPRPVKLAAVLLAAGLVFATPAIASVVPEHSPALADKQLAHPDLHIPEGVRTLADLPAPVAAVAFDDLDRLGVAEELARIDPRGGGWATLMPAWPLLPGDGVGNTLTWEQLGVAAPADGGALEQAAWNAFLGFVSVHADALRIDPSEVSPDGRAVAAPGGDLVQIHAPRRVAGVPVRDSYLTAVISHGNLVLFGAHRWAPVTTSTRPAISLDDARGLLRTHLAPLADAGTWDEPELLLVPMAHGRELDQVPLGQGYDYRLAWALRPAIAGELGRWEMLIDAASGETLAFLDSNRYASLRRVQGGVYPVSNDGTPPDGVEQAGWPMPFDRVSAPGGTVTTDSGGNLPGCINGNITSTLTGEFVNINDACGAISLTSAGDIDFGTSGGTNCTTPGFGGAGNTHSARTGFHELNRIKEMARGQLPANPWLSSQLTANMNLNSTCNAFWNGSTVNFYREGGGCANTGELAGVFDHEWGHGIDDNDANPSVSNPGEGIADLYAALRLNSSCIGRGFFLSGANCSGYGDPCTNCTGIRDVDWAERSSGSPHDVDWIDTNCPFSFSSGPCGGAVHCEGTVYSEAVWDLYTRDLPSAPFNLSADTALEVTTRLTYLGAGSVGTWFQCTTPFGGCAATGGYLNYLAADDDNGTLADGTPHMSALFAAFDRHGVACNSPTVANSGCAGTPTAAPSVTATAGDKSVALSWGAVAGASSYQVFRTDGVFACGFGKVKVGETTGTSFTDSGLQNGREYSYVVTPMGPSASCFGPASACDTVVPVAGPDPCAPGGLSLQFGTETIDERVRTVSLTGFTDPVVVMGPPSYDGTHASTIRVLNVTATSFDHFLDEWDYLDGNHKLESAGYLVLEAGPQTLGTLAADAGARAVGTGWVSVSFGQTFAAPPVVKTQVATQNDAAAVTTRVRNVTATGFQVRLQEEEAADGIHADETVHWIAIAAGSASFDAGELRVGTTGTTVTHAFSSIAFGASVNDPAFLADMQTFAGNNTATLRYRNLTATGVQVKVEEEQSADNEVNHVAENVGWIAIGL